MQKSLIRRCKLLILASILFVILIGLAMLAYPGGSEHDRASVHYNFFENSISDLGATMTVSGKQNTVSNILFITAFGSLGIILIYFSKIWRAMDTDIHRLSAVGYLSKICLILSGLSFIGIAFSPLNKFYENHMLLLKSAFCFLLAWTLLMIILQAGNLKIRKLLVSNIIYALILSYYVYLLFYGSENGMDETNEFQAVSQKIILLVTMVNLIIQASGINRFLRIADFRKNGAKNFYV